MIDLKFTNKNIDLESSKVGHMQINFVSVFNYLGAKANGKNSIQDEIKERWAKANRVYYANQILLKIKLISKQMKLRLYRTIIRPIVTYACETWVLKEAMKQKLLVFKGKFLEESLNQLKRLMANKN